MMRAFISWAATDDMLYGISSTHTFDKLVICYIMHRLFALQYKLTRFYFSCDSFSPGSEKTDGKISRNSIFSFPNNW